MNKLVWTNIPQVVEISDLEVLDFCIFTELAILKYFLTWSFEHAEIPLLTYFQSNEHWLNLATYSDKY